MAYLKNDKLSINNAKDMKKIERDGYGEKGKEREPSLIVH